MSSISGPDLSLKPESDLISLACDGDSDAFGVLYEKYIDQIYNYIYFRTSNGKDAEDICSRVFIRALNHIEKYEDRGYPFSAWLYRIAHNLVVNWYRDRERSNEVSLSDQYPPPTMDGSVEESIEKEDETEALLRIIRDLPEDRKELLILKHVEGLTNEEIGKIMDRTEGAIKALYHRTLESLRDDYEF
ncbi:MAG: sigma-70 family RNA polymerase sigma factor [Chloroflexi bacterium]|nr:sigma-70 family RNA polymerase sigma factor [Chloroflexota bacterium]